MNTTVIRRSASPPASLARTVLGIFKLRIGVLIMITRAGGPGDHAGAGGAGSCRCLVLALSVLVASASCRRLQPVRRGRGRPPDGAHAQRARSPAARCRTSPLWLALIGALLAAAVGAAAWLVVNAGRRAVHLPRRVLLWRGLHGVAEAAQLDSTSSSAASSGSFAVLAGAAAVDPALGRPAAAAGAGAVPVDAAAFLEPGDRLPGRLRRRRRADAAGGGGRAARGAHRARQRDRAGGRVAAAGVLRRRAGLCCSAALLGGAYFLRKTWALARAPSRAHRDGGVLRARWCS